MTMPTVDGTLRRWVMALLLLGGAMSPTGAAAQACAPDNDGLTLPRGFCAIIFSDSVPAPRDCTPSECSVGPAVPASAGLAAPQAGRAPHGPTAPAGGSSRSPRCG